MGTGNPSVMGSSNTNVPLYPSVVILFLSLDRQRGARGDFLSIILKSPFIPLCQRGIKTPITEGLQQTRNSNFEIQNCFYFGHLNFGHSDLFRVSNFVLRIYFNTVERFYLVFFHQNYSVGSDSFFSTGKSHS